MKFGRDLRNHAAPEWRKGYIDYRRLKKVIKRVTNEDFGGNIEKSQQQPSQVPSQTPSSPQPGFASESLEQNIDSTNLGRNSLDSATTAGRQAIGNNANGHVSTTTAMSQTATNRPRTRRNISRQPSYHRQEQLNMEQIRSLATPAQRRFITALEAELEKVVSFYEERKAEAIYRFQALSQQTEEYNFRKQRLSKLNGEYEQGSKPSTAEHNSTTDGKQTSAGGLPSTIKSSLPFRVPHVTDQVHDLGPRDSIKSARRSLKLAIFEFYRFLGILRNYCNLNRAGFSKILKKFEKVTGFKISAAYMEKVNNSNFVTSTTADELTQSTEELFAKTFTKGSRKKALERLRIMGVSKMHHFSAFRSGMMFGLGIPALVDGLYRSFQPDTREAITYWPGLLQLFGALSLPIIFLLLFSVNLLTWHRNRINYILIFEFDIRNQIDFRQYLEIPTLLFFTLSYAFWLSFANFWPDHLDPWAYPVIWLGLTVFIIINPLPILYPQARWWFLRSLTRVFSAGLIHVEFRDFFIGDQLVSMYYTFYNIGFLICGASRKFSGVPSQHCNTNFTYVSAVLAALPALLRLGQSFRRYKDSSFSNIHLFNAGKYSATVLYYFLYFHWRVNGSHSDYSMALFIVFAIINSVYSLSWDIFMDWNLLKPRVKYFGLRQELGYSSVPWTYYLATILDFLGRFTWTWYLAPQPSINLRGWIIGAIEILRRWLWNFYRVESEHVGNMDGFRVTRDIPLPYVLSGARASQEYDDGEDSPPQHSAATFRNKWYSVFKVDNDESDDDDDSPSPNPKYHRGQKHSNMDEDKTEDDNYDDDDDDFIHETGKKASPTVDNENK